MFRLGKIGITLCLLLLSPLNKSVLGAEVAVFLSGDLDAYQTALNGVREIVKDASLTQYNMKGDLSEGKQIISQILDRQPNAVLARQQYQRAVLFGTPEEVRAILEAHPDANLPAMRVSGHGTGLHQAAFQGRPGVAMVLLEFGADPNATASNNQTPLHIACRRDRPKVVLLLLKHGADIEAKDSGGFTPRQRAGHFKRANIVRMLDEHAVHASKDVKN